MVGPASRHSSLRRLLAGGDRRSIAGANRVLSIVRARPERIDELARLVEDEDWLVSLRALDVLEKLAHARPDWIGPYKKVLIGRLAESDKWEIRLQIVRALPLVPWSARERARAVEILRSNLAHPQKFVRAWALDSLATMSIEDLSLRRVVRRALTQFDASGSKALESRARHIRLRLASSPAAGIALTQFPRRGATVTSKKALKAPGDSNKPRKQRQEHHGAGKRRGKRRP